MSPDAGNSPYLPIRTSTLSSFSATDANDLARAYHFAPSDDTTEPPHLFLKVFLQIRKELDSNQISSPEPSASYQSWYDSFHNDLEDLKQTTKNIEDTVETLEDTHDVLGTLSSKIDDLDETVGALSNKIDDVDEAVKGLDGRLDEAVKGLDGRLDNVEEAVKGLDERLDEAVKGLGGRLGNLEEQYDKFLAQVENAVAIQRNAIVSRHHDIVTPLRVRTADEIEQRNPRQMKWYWRLLEENRTSELIRLHEYYQLQPSIWLMDYSGEDSNDDSDDLDRGVPVPSTIPEAVGRYQERAVRVLFSHLGLRYEHFEKFETERRAQVTKGPSKRRSTAHREGPMKREYRADSGTTKSDIGSTTQPFTSPTQSAGT